MKARLFFLTLISFLVLFSACKKDRNSNEVYGTVTEFGTDKPLVGLEVKLFDTSLGSLDTDNPTGISDITDENGAYSMRFSTKGLKSVGVEAEGYFSKPTSVLNAAGDNEKNFVLDPHAYLHLRVKNVAPAEELDAIFLSALIDQTVGSSETYIGAGVNLNYVIRKPGNRDHRIAWNTYNSGMLLSQFRDTVFIPAHDTLYYEINY